MYFDTHAHYNDEAFNADRHEVITSAFKAGVELIVNASCEKESCLSSLELAHKHPFLYAAVGWHPHDAKTFNEESPEFIKKWCADPKVVAVGEIGLDYYYDLSERGIQREVFIKQMELARELSLPAIVHNREAHADSLEIVRMFPEVTGVFHCFAGSAEMARELLSLGWYLGFNGAITFKNAKKAPDVLQMCPLDRIVIETDCPYLTPVPFRGRRNDSSYLPLVAAGIAELKNTTPEEIARITLENGRRLFTKI